MKRDQVRIIAGKWRGRKIAFPSTSTLRPTPDRVRETLFNWLAPHIIGTHCLDLFGGSGALSFEALSRGAGSVVILEQDPSVLSSLKANAEHLKTENFEIIQVDSLDWLRSFSNQLPAPTFDIIFADPPYSKKLLPDCFSLIEKVKLLNRDGLIYFESDEPLLPNSLPQSMKILKSKRAGNVFFGLVASI